MQIKLKNNLGYVKIFNINIKHNAQMKKKKKTQKKFLKDV